MRMLWKFLSIVSLTVRVTSLSLENLLLGRRRFVCQSAASTAILLPSSPTPMAALASELPVADSAEEGISRQCRNGALSMEQAIPGAYSQICMAIPIREIPVRLPSSGRSKMEGENVVTLRIEQQVAAAGSTGTAIWNSSLLLKQLLERLVDNEPSLLENKTILELGCGTGLVSMAAAHLGAQQVLATDGNSLVMELAKRNVNANDLSDRVTTQQLQWGMMDAMDLAGRANIVIGADLTYSPGSWRQLAESMETVLSDDGVIIYLSLGHTGFNVNAEVDGFLSVTQQQGLETVQPSSLNWPFQATRENLSTILQKTMLPSDCQVVQSTGGVRVVVLRRRTRRKRL